MTFVALLRGINVGKSIQIPMKTLKSIMGDIGLENAITYLNSGNVVFDSNKNSQELMELIGNELEKEYQQKIPTLVKTAQEIIEIAESIPTEWSSDKYEQTYVAYLFKEAARPEIISELPIKKEYMNIMYSHEAII